MPGKYGQLYSHTECYACNRYGKFAYKIPDLKPKAMNIAIIGVIMMQNGDVIKKIWIILDTFSTDTMTNNLGYVEDVMNCKKYEELTVLMNGGSLLFDRKGRLTFYL